MYTLTKEPNSPVIFLARLSEITDRLDPAMVWYKRRTHRFRYARRALRTLFSEAPEYGAAERGLERTSSEQPRYIRITDIDELGILSNELGATAGIVEPRFMLQENDLLIARSGNTVGKSYIHKTALASYPCFFAGYLIRFRFDHNTVLPDYVFAVTQLPFYKEWIEATRRPAGQPNINAQEYARLEIPIPPKKIQSDVVNRLREAYDSKRSKDTEARRVLNTIDNLLLEKLGISLPPEPPNTIHSRMFQRSMQAISGKRFDPIAHQPQIALIEKAIAQGTYPTEMLGRLASFKKNVTSEVTETDTYVGLENIDGETGEYFATGERESVSSAIRFSSGQILFPKLRPYLNKTHLAKFSGICSTEFLTLSVREVLAEYLVEVLRCRPMIQITTSLMTGNTLPRLQPIDVVQLRVPVPPTKVQQSIAAKATAIRRRALAMRGEAKEQLDNAKSQIEAMILGKQ